QVGEGFSSLGLERFSGFAAPRAINVPLACGVQCAGQTGLAIVPGPLGVYMGVDRVRDGGIGAAGFVLIDERGAFAIVAHPGHQVAQGCATGRRECVSVCRRSWKCRPGAPIAATACGQAAERLELPRRSGPPLAPGKASAPGSALAKTARW